MRKFPLLILLLLGLAFAASSRAEKLRVVTRNVEPFSFEKDGVRTGFAMDLWKEIARTEGFDYEVKTVGTAQEMIDALTNKSADVAVGALSVTSAREAVMDFTQPFYESGLQILVTGSGSSFAGTIGQVLGNLFNWRVLGMLAVLILLMLLISHLVWQYEHKVNPEMWPETYHHGLWESFWWTISILLVGGADNKGPVGVGGRIVAIIWMLLSIILLAFLTASFTTILTINTLKGDISGPSDLPGRTVATIHGSTAETWLTSHRSQVVTYANIQDCIEALKKKQVAAVVYDAPMLQYAVQQDGDTTLNLIDPIFNRQNYAIGLQQDSPVRERINRALLSLSEGGFDNTLNEKWFGKAP